jgi:hypothetical protein
MPMSPEIRDREHSKFRDADDNKSKVAVSIEQSPSNPIPVASTQLSLKTLIDEVSLSLSYVGDADPGSTESSSVWRIRKIETIGTITYVLFASGLPDFDNVWDDRASLIYS